MYWTIDLLLSKADECKYHINVRQAITNCKKCCGKVLTFHIVVKTVADADLEFTRATGCFLQQL